MNPNKKTTSTPRAGTYTWVWIISMVIVLIEAVFVFLNASEIWQYAWPKFLKLITHLWSLPYLTSFGLLVVVFLLEILVLGYRRSSIHALLNPSMSARGDLWMKVLTDSGIHRILTMTSVFMLPVLAMAYLPQWIRFDIRPLDYLPYQVMGFLVWILLDDFLDYWCHRFSHGLKFWWAVHGYHHSATEFNIITGTRVHFLDEGITHTLKVLPLVVMGIPLNTFIALIFIRQIVDILQHSRVNWGYGWVGRWIIFSPNGHRLHHSLVREQWNKNFGNIFVIWDRIFGTWYHGADVSENIGLANSRYNSGSTAKDLWVGARDCIRALRDSLQNRRWLVSTSDPS